MDFLDADVSLRDTNCSKIEQKEIQAQSVTVGQIILPEKNLEDWRKEQRQDSVLMKILHGMETGVCPSRLDFGTRDVSSRIYISY